MKKFALVAVAAILAVVMAFSFAACENKELNLGTDIAGEQPDADEAIVAVTEDMSAIEMLTTGMDNYYNSSFVAARTTGALTTKVAGLTLTQFVKSVTLRDGAADGDNKIFYQNQSGTVGGGLGSLVKIIIWEETDYEKTGGSESVYFRTAAKNSLEAQATEEGGQITEVKLEWKDGVKFDATQKYDVLKTFVDEKASDPTRIWMYDLQAHTILADKTIAPQKATDPDTGAEYYTFTVYGNVNKDSGPNYSVADYEKQMRHMLQSQNTNPSEFYFTEIKLDVSIWPNGLFRSVNVTESYYMKIASIISSTVTLESTKAFYYDKESLPTGDEAYDLSQIGTVKGSYKG